MARAWQAGESTARQNVEAALERIAAGNGSVNAFLSVDPAAALARAAALDACRSKAAEELPLAGVPIGVKDNLAVAGMPATCGSRMLEHFRAPHDATAVRRLSEAGAIVVGKTNLDEFAMGSRTTSGIAGATRNPWDRDRIAGGSSGGSAAAVAAGMVPAALGSDTGGSVRQPAAWCGVCGFKPTWGSISRWGLIAYASSLDQIGFFARRAEDLARLFSLTSGPDPLDQTAIGSKVCAEELLAAPVQGLRLGWIPDLFPAAGLPETMVVVRDAIAALSRTMAELQTVDLPCGEALPAVYYILAMSEASSNLARYDGVRYGHRSESPSGGLPEMIARTREEGFGPEVRRRILLGTFALSSGACDQYFTQASRVRRLVRDQLLQQFRSVDLIALPTTFRAAPRLVEEADPVEGYQADRYTVVANLAGLPALSLPCGFTSDGMPVGLQLIAAPFREDLLLSVARDWQLRTDWHLRRPPG